MTKGLNNLIWVMESQQSSHDVAMTDTYYPGDDYVDVFGHNFYDDDWVLPFDANELFSRYPKVYGFPQAGSQTNRNINSFDNLVMRDAIQSRFPRSSFFITWNSFSNSGYQARAMIDHQHVNALLNDPWIGNRDQLGWTNELANINRMMAGPGPNQFRWRGGVLAASTNLLQWTVVASPTNPVMLSLTGPHFFRLNL